MKLFEHQKQALQQTKDFNKVAYYLDMGLGKTFVGSEKMKDLNSNLNLIICQKSKLQDWLEHIQEYYPEYNTFIYSKTRDIPPKSVILINYDLVWRRPELARLKNFTLMLDESSLIKNASSKRTKFITRDLKPDNIILLSGTPCGGRYEELYTQIKLLGWNISKKLYWDNYINFINMDVGGFKVPKVLGYKNVDRLKEKLKNHGCIFMKTDEAFSLPEQVETPVIIGNTREYKKFNKERIITVDSKELIGDTSLTKLLYLRQLASQYNKNKLNALKDLLEGTQDRVIIFYNFNQELELIKILCEKLDKPTSIVNGQVKDLENYNNKDNAVILVQYQAGAMGLNLQLSNKIIYFSLPLASDMFEQSKKRTHRIGQTRTCFYWYLITKNSIEEKIFETLKERKDFTDKLFQKLEGDNCI